MARRKSRERAEQRRAELKVIAGKIPFPVEIDCAAPLLEFETYKDINCPSYDACLTLAGVGDWKAFSCRACPCFAGQGILKRRIRRVAIRLKCRVIRKVRQCQEKN